MLVRMGNSWRCGVAVAGVITVCLFGCGCASPPPPPPQTFNEQVAATLHRLAERDQEARRASLAKSRDSNLRATVQRIDRENTAELRGIIQQFGWPGRSLVGQRGAHAAWMIIQHADEDPAFQKECLKRMEAAPDGEVSPEDVAFLTDRLLVADGKKQRYGTQFAQVGRQFVPLPIADEANVDARRKAAGLPPLAEYAKQVTELYGPPAQEK